MNLLNKPTGWGQRSVMATEGLMLGAQQALEGKQKGGGRGGRDETQRDLNSGIVGMVLVDLALKRVAKKD